MARTPPKATKATAEGYTVRNPNPDKIVSTDRMAELNKIYYYEGDTMLRADLSDVNLMFYVRRGVIASADLTDADRAIFTAAGVMIPGIAKDMHEDGDSDGN